MKKGIMILALLQMVVGVQAVVYKLERVEKIVSGEKYVLVHSENGCALSADGSKNALNAILDYKKKDLIGNENYVWTAKKISGVSGYYLNSYTPTYWLNLTTDNKLWVESASKPWQFSFQADSTAKIGTGGYYISFSSSNKFTASVYTPASLFVYRLVAETYERELTKLNIGTICLPYAVDSVTGAEVYELSYLEKDAQGNPYNVYYTQKVNTMEAGKPYIFVPSDAKVIFQKAETTTVAAPVKYRGFYGTFSSIVDGDEGAAGNLLENKYVLSNNTFQLCGDHCQMGAYRGYFNFDETPNTPPTQGVQQRMVAIGQEGVRYIEPYNIGTRIDNANANVNANKVMMDGRLVIVINGIRYNAQGQRL